MANVADYFLFRNAPHCSFGNCSPVSATGTAGECTQNPRCVPLDSGALLLRWGSGLGLSPAEGRGFLGSDVHPTLSSFSEIGSSAGPENNMTVLGAACRPVSVL